MSIKSSLFCCSQLTRYVKASLDLFTLQSMHTTSKQCAGHNKWSKIKRKKAVADMERSQYTHKYVQKIISAIKTGGSTDPDKNLKLGSVVQQAKSAGVPKANIDSAIKRAVNKMGSGSAESILLNGRGSSGYLLLIEAVTDNIKRTRPQLKSLLEKNGAVLSDPGSATFNFEHKALVQVPTSTFPSLTDPLELAIEIGAEDVDTVNRDEASNSSEDRTNNRSEKTGDDNSFSLNSTSDYQFKCDVTDLRQVLKSLREKGVNELTTTFEYLPKILVELSDEKYEQASQVVDVVCEHEDVVEVYSNFTLAEQTS